ncbi:MAG TPA: PspC domain-containing protein [Candidatus Saccharimonadales bacterium]|nr:PspC domain-containing protein [Candidatus Saccharimonadales bacterium]
MNEVTKVHLGRQAFTISIAAQKELRAYLDAIAKQVDDDDVADEVELRLAELLSERGVTGDKVILPADVKNLKEQLGDPKDFKEDDSSAKTHANAPSERRLFRDPSKAWVAGVASGIAAYFGVDALLIRILFIIGTFAWGGSILLYIVLWLLVPEAKTSSDRLQMAGKPITVESLKEVVERADVKGTVHRASGNLAEPASRVRDGVNGIFSLIVKIIGIGLTLWGLVILIGLAFCGVYLAVHGNVVYDNLFPVGLKEHLLVYLAGFVGTMMGIFIILFGMAVFRRKWPIRGWITGVLVGLTLIGLVGGGALAADTVPNVRDRYNAHLHTVVRPLKSFSSVVVNGQNASVNFQTANNYSVSLQYFDNANVGAIKTNVKDGVLTIDSTNFDWHRNCPNWCIPDTYNMVVTVYSPNVPSVNMTSGDRAVFGPNYYVKPMPVPMPVLNN